MESMTLFTNSNAEKAQALLERYPVKRSALLPLLHLVQSQDGYVTDEGIAECARLVGLTKAEVAAVATFYTMYKREPLGRHLVSVCTNFSCKVRGAGEVYERLTQRLGVGHNQTTADGAITLEHAECLGNCDGAPVVSVDYLNYECLSPEAAVALVDRVAAGDVPPPTRGYPPPGIREVGHQLACVGPAGAATPGAAPQTAQGAGGDAAERPAPHGEGADEPVDDLGPTSGTGGHDYPGGSAQKDDEATDPSADTPAGGQEQ